MGVPDLMRFVARDAADALRKMPTRATPESKFDYILVDMSNALQTLTTAQLQDLLLRHVVATKAIIFVLDGQRQRQGTVREQRQFMQQREGDVAVQQLAVSILESGSNAPQAKRATTESGATNGNGCGRVIVLGRDVAGEGDYKLLSLHRRIQAAHAARRSNAAIRETAPSPRFLFVSEDSDVLCGALLGPEPHNVFLATNLHSALHELQLLDIGKVVRRLYSTSGLVTYLATHPRGFSATDEAAVAQQPVAVRKTFDDAAQAPAVVARRVKTTPQQVAVRCASLDFIFLFSLILGTSTTPSITKGATRVDAAACWTHYAAIMRGNKKLLQGTAVAGPLLRIGSDDTGADTVVLDAEILSTLLEARFADEVSHIPTPDERKYAREYVKYLVSAVMQLAVGAPYDSRAEAGKYTKPPSVACFTSVLGLHDERAYSVKFDFSLQAVSLQDSRAGDDSLQPLRRVQAFFDYSSVRLALPAHPTAPLFWPPHEAKPLAGNSGVHRAEVALPLGAIPTLLNTPLAAIDSVFTASIDAAVYLGVTDESAFNHDPAASTKVKGAGTTQAALVFDFDMRRMVPASNAALSRPHQSEASVPSDTADQKQLKAKILAAAGVSTSYYAGPAPKPAAAPVSATMVDGAVPVMLGDDGLPMPSDKRNKLIARAAKLQLQQREAANATASHAAPTESSHKVTLPVKQALANVSSKRSSDAPADAGSAKPKKAKRLGKKERAKQALRDARGATKKAPRKA